MKRPSRLGWLLAVAACGLSQAAAGDEIRIDTRTASGDIIAGAECVGANANGVQKFRSGLKQPVQSSSSELLLVCTAAGHGAAIGTLKPSPTAAYAHWVDMVFGQVLVFERVRDVRGPAVKGQPPESVPDRRGAADPMSQACSQQLPGAQCRKE
jgi:hypothetical protein